MDAAKFPLLASTLLWLWWLFLLLALAAHELLLAAMIAMQLCVIYYNNGYLFWHGRLHISCWLALRYELRLPDLAVKCNEFTSWLFAVVAECFCH